MLDEKIQKSLDDSTSVFALIGLVGSLRKATTSLGRSSYVVTGKGKEVKTAFRVVDAKNLIISNNLDGTINPAFPAELQPRDRTRLTSKVQVSKIAGNLRPAQLTDSGLSSHGAPIVGADNVVESGNGRSMGITRAYEQGQADDYRQYLIDHAQDYGLKAEDVAQMDMPVLVRERLTEVDRAQFAKDSNLSDLQEMAASEKAFVDAEMLNENLMAMFNPSDDGNLLARSNDGFIRAFMREIGDTATAGLLTEDGRPTKQLIDRIQNAIFARAYKDERLVKLVSEEPDPEMRNILTALNTAASEFAQMQSLSGDVHRQAVHGLVDGVQTVDGLDQKAIAALQEAINLVRQAKDTGQAIEEAIAQQGLFEETSKEAEALALFIVSNNRSAKRIGAAFKKLAQKINAELLHQQQAMGDMFGGGELSLADVLGAVSNEIEEEFGEGKGLNFAMFESSPDGDPARRKVAAKVVAGAMSADDLISIVGGFPPIQPGDVPVATIMAAIHRLLKTGPKDTAALDAYQSLTSLTVGKKLADVKKKFSPDSVYSLLRQSGMVSVAKQADWSLIFNQGELLQYAGLIREFMNSTDQETRTELARQIYPVYYRRLSGKKTFSYGLMAALRLSGVTVFNKAYSELAKAANYIPPATISTEEAQRAASENIEAGERTLSDLKIGESDEKRALAECERLRAASYDFYDIYPKIKVSSALAFRFARIGPNYEESLKIVRGSQSIMQHYSAADHALLDEVENLNPKLAKTMREFTVDRVDETQNVIDEHVQGIISASRITEEQAAEWVANLDIDKEAIKSFDARFGKDALQRNLSDIYRLTGGKLKKLTRITFRNSARASANIGTGGILLADNDGLDVLWHEAGHHFEFNDPNMLATAKAFLAQRKKSDEIKTWEYKKGKVERGIDAGFSTPYIGRLYGNGTIEGTDATEIFSMGFQMLKSTRYRSASMASDDKVLDFVLGQIQKEHK